MKFPHSVFRFLKHTKEDVLLGRFAGSRRDREVLVTDVRPLPSSCPQELCRSD